MSKSKQKSLRRKGWEANSAEAVLSQSDGDVAYGDLKSALAVAVAARRQEMRASQALLAKWLGSSQSRVAKMEAGDASVSLDLLIRSLLSMGATPCELADVVVSAQTASSRRENRK